MVRSNGVVCTIPAQWHSHNGLTVTRIHRQANKRVIEHNTHLFARNICEYHTELDAINPSRGVSNRSILSCSSSSRTEKITRVGLFHPISQHPPLFPQACSPDTHISPLLPSFLGPFGEKSFLLFWRENRVSNLVARRNGVETKQNEDKSSNCIVDVTCNDVR